MTIWELIQQYCDDTGATEAAVQRKALLNKGTFSAWRRRGVPALPTHAQILGLAHALKTPYETVLEALIESTNYRDELSALRQAIADVSLRIDETTTKHAVVREEARKLLVADQPATREQLELDERLARELSDLRGLKLFLLELLDGRDLRPWVGDDGNFPAIAQAFHQGRRHGGRGYLRRITEPVSDPRPTVTDDDLAELPSVAEPHRNDVEGEEDPSDP